VGEFISVYSVSSCSVLAELDLVTGAVESESEGILGGVGVGKNVQTVTLTSKYNLE
jgi:hypothetical protein